MTKGYGTGVLEQEAHVFHIEKKTIGKEIMEVPMEVLVDNPLAIIKKSATVFFCNVDKNCWIDFSMNITVFYEYIVGGSGDGKGMGKGYLMCRS